MTECIIKSVESNTGFQPTIANFQNGQLKPSQASKLQCVLLQNEDKQNVVVASDKMAYIGSEIPNELCHTLLTIRNKKTNEVRFVPVDTMSFGAVVSHMNSTLDSMLDQTKSSVSILSKEFGSKKSKRRTEQMEKMQMDVSHVETELKEAVSKVKLTKEDLVQPTVDTEKSYLPPINRDASSVEKVYRLKHLISSTEMDSLEDLATKVLMDEVSEEEMCPFVQECLTEIKNSPDPNLVNVKVFLFIEALIRFFKMPVKVLGKKKFIEIDMYPAPVCTKILNEFTINTNNGRSRPLSMRDKFVSYSIVLSLIALDYTLDLERLTSSLGVGLKKLIEVSKVLGTTIKGKVVTLKLPLPEQHLPVKRMRKK